MGSSRNHARSGHFIDYLITFLVSVALVHILLPIEIENYHKINITYLNDIILRFVNIVSMFSLFPFDDFFILLPRAAF